MKLLFGSLILVSLISACSNDLVVVDQWKDIPVVWGLLNKSDTAHYIRVEKAFLDPTTSAYDIARIPDSLYYENAVVTLKRVNTGQVFTLDRVNGDLEGYPREDGTFAESPNYLYKIKANVINLVAGESYEFKLQRGNETTPVTAHTIIIPKPILTEPNPSPGTKISFKYNSNVKFSWREVPDAGIYDLKLVFHYSEKLDSVILPTPKSFEWNVERNISYTEVIKSGIEFYNAVKSNIQVDVHKTRTFDGIDIIVWAGGKELADFIKITHANTGITSTQDIPKYTNLSEGVGIFSSRNNALYTGFILTDQSLDSLKNGVITKSLNFK
jgi:hypothetical protein